MDGMNRVQFSMPQRGINVTKSMVQPKNYTSIKHWLRNARRAIPQIPDTENPGLGWKIFDEVISDETIMLDIRDRNGVRCAVIMERKGTMSKKG